MQNKTTWFFFILIITTLSLSLLAGNATAEAFENIDEKDARSIYVLRELEKSFTFRNEALDITYINITTDLNVGNVEAIVECLKSTSSMVSTPPEGTVYKNINIWVGDSKLQHRLVSSEVGFRVNRTWLEDNEVSEQSVKLSIYHSGNWDILPTEKTYEDAEYVYYEANTSNEIRTHFAIVEYIENEPVSSDVGDDSVAEDGMDSDPLNDGSDMASEGNENTDRSGAEEADLSDLNMLTFAIPILMVLVVLYSSYYGTTKEENIGSVGNGWGIQNDKQVGEDNASEKIADRNAAKDISGKDAKNEPHDKGK
ncbi:PGF-pre-PGF domain-containing protein [Methanococcoides methylutens]|uniref:PGF-pre-PGF domain-containing protein n=1 Tax=Methanococcoides methylutens TaxID=2226 RepID=UPI0018CE41CC|nr:PGF-pre-PGF domain-containing protein [Methanococcoides methylutens]